MHIHILCAKVIIFSVIHEYFMVKIRKKGEKRILSEKTYKKTCIYRKIAVTLHSLLKQDTFQTSCLYRGVEQLVARQAHNLEVIRSSRISATISTGILLNKDSGFFVFKAGR